MSGPITGWRKLRLSHKLRVFEARKWEGCHLSVVVGSEHVYVSRGFERNEIVALRRGDLSEDWRVELPRMDPKKTGSLSMGAREEWDESTLLLHGFEELGALDIVSRETLWRTDGRVCSHWLHRLFVIDQGERCLADLDVRSGARTLLVDLPKSVDFSISCEQVVIGSPSRWVGIERGPSQPLLGIDLERGCILWERDVESEVRRTHGLADEDSLTLRAGSLPGLFIGTTDRFTIGCSSETGEVLWVTEAPVPYRWPLVANGRIPILGRDEFLVLDEASGKVLCRTPQELTGVLHAKTGATYGDSFVTVSESGDMLLFDLRDGALLWRKRFRASLWETVIVDGRLLVTDAAGQIWVFEGR